MESEIEHISSTLFDQSKILDQIEKIKQASEEAQQRIDEHSAQDDQVLLSIHVIEQFLKKKHRICYGGQAINAYLPKKYKFYDPDTSIPDYDFYTPSQTSDILILYNDLRKAGFTEIYVREGMHEGTLKVYVNFIPVADLTAMDPGLYQILSKRSSKIDGISYLDANALRMLMYLELSRPAGEVSRWEKVFERLLLFNEFAPIRSCKMRPLIKSKNRLTMDQLKFTVEYMIQHDRVFAGADLLPFYQHSFKRNKASTWMISQQNPILFFSSDSATDARQILSELERSRITSPPFEIKTYSHKGLDLIPSIQVICQGKTPLIIVIEESACHSYYTVELKDRPLRIASIDTLITLYFCLGFVKSSFFDLHSMECLANHLVQLSVRARKHSDEFLFPFITIDCSGHQETTASLIRSKVSRITQKKPIWKEKLRKLQKKSTVKQLRPNASSD